MYDFKLFVENKDLMEMDEPAPPGVDPEMWAAANERMRNYLRTQAQGGIPQAPQGTPSQPVTYKVSQAARALGPVQGQTGQAYQGAGQTGEYQGASDIENAVRTYLSRLQGMPTEGSLDALKEVDLDLATAIVQAIQTKKIPLHDNRSRTFGNRGVNFFRGKNGGIGFIINR